MDDTIFNERVNELWTKTRAKLLPRSERFKTIESLTEEYFESRGKMPNADVLDRLSTLCLYEEISDDTAWKSRQSEYPFLSDEQMARRKEGVHQRKNEAGQREVDLKKAISVGTDGRDQRRPTRRERSDNENIYVDTETKSRNKQRKKAYLKFTEVQPVTTYRLEGLDGYSNNSSN